MKSMSVVFFLCLITITTITCRAKRPKKEKPEPNIVSKIDRLQEYEEYKEAPIYHPNPIILNSVGQIMNGALSIAQDPHNRPNIGHSVASMIHAIISIIIERVLANKKIDPAHLKAFEDCCDELSEDLNKEITEIIITKSFMINSD